MTQIKPIVKPLLRHHIEEMEDRIGPGMEDLCWASLGIESYIQNMEKGADCCTQHKEDATMLALHIGLESIGDLVNQVNDLLENRIEMNIQAITHSSFVDLPEERFVILSEDR